MPENITKLSNKSQSQYTTNIKCQPEQLVTNINRIIIQLYQRHYQISNFDYKIIGNNQITNTYQIYFQLYHPKPKLGYNQYIDAMLIIICYYLFTNPVHTAFKSNAFGQTALSIRLLKLLKQALQYKINKHPINFSKITNSYPNCTNDANELSYQIFTILKKQKILNKIAPRLDNQAQSIGHTATWNTMVNLRYKDCKDLVKQTPRKLPSFKTNPKFSQSNYDIYKDFLFAKTMLKEYKHDLSKKKLTQYSQQILISSESNIKNSIKLTISQSHNICKSLIKQQQSTKALNII